MQLRLDGEVDALEHRESDEQNTPRWIIETARAVMGGIDLDPASNARAQETVRASNWYGLDVGRDGLLLPWAGRVWCNPPYSLGRMDDFARRAVAEWDRGEVTRMMLLVNASMNSQWMRLVMASADALLIPNRRISFVSAATGETRKGNEYDQVLLAWGCGRRVEQYVKHHGWTLWRA